MNEQDPGGAASKSASGVGTATFVWDGYRWKYVSDTCISGYHPDPSKLPAHGTYGVPETIDCEPDRAAFRDASTQLRSTPAPGGGARAQYGAISRMNLIYHVYPNTANDVWLRNVRQLRRRMGIFNGRKIVAVATGPGLADLDQVRQAIDWPEVEYLAVPNDPEIGEVASFSKLLAAVRTKDPCEASFYGHTKGSANGRHDPRAIETWRNAMYATLLDAPDQVKDALRRFACVGCLKKVHPNTCAFPSMVPWAHWHFCGTYFWFRHDRVFGDARWSCVPYDYWGAEMWLGGFLDAAEACSLYQPRPETDIGWTAYESKFWGRETGAFRQPSAA